MAIPTGGFDARSLSVRSHSCRTVRYRSYRTASGFESQLGFATMPSRLSRRPARGSASVPPSCGSHHRSFPATTGSNSSKSKGGSSRRTAGPFPGPSPAGCSPFRSKQLPFQSRSSVEVAGAGEATVSRLVLVMDGPQPPELTSRAEAVSPPPGKSRSARKLRRDFFTVVVGAFGEFEHG